MKKITITFTLLAFIIISGCGSVEPKKESTTVKKENIKKDSKKVEEKFDFRKSNWEMTQKDVAKIEIDKDIFEIPDITPIAFYEEISGINFLVMYKFEDNKLVSGVYSALGKSVTPENGEKLKKILYEKYGKEQKIDGNGKIYWKTDNSEIEFFINLEIKELSVTYSNVKYIESKKAEKTKTNIEENVKKEDVLKF